MKPDRDLYCLPWVTSLARGAGATVHLLWVRPPDSRGEGHHLERWRRRCEKAGVPAECHRREGEVAPEIAAAAEELGADLVVLAHNEDSHRVHGIQQRLLQTEHLRRPPCPVVLVPTPDRKPEPRSQPPRCDGPLFGSGTVEERARAADGPRGLELDSQGTIRLERRSRSGERLEP